LNCQDKVRELVRFNTLNFVMIVSGEKIFYNLDI
jgi:hypothetical protein